MERVFTYGTLMKGQRVYGTFGDMKSFCDGILNGYGLYEAGTYPAAVPVKDFCVYGEIYEVNEETLKRLDEYEGEGFLYLRKRLPIETETGTVEAWVYVYNRDVSSLELREPIGKWTSQRRPAVKV